jgi:hypothetical protein
VVGDTRAGRTEHDYSELAAKKRKKPDLILTVTSRMAELQGGYGHHPHR